MDVIQHFFALPEVGSRLLVLGSWFLVLGSWFLVLHDLPSNFRRFAQKCDLRPAPALQLALRAQTVGLMAPTSGAFLAHRLRFEGKSRSPAQRSEA